MSLNKNFKEKIFNLAVEDSIYFDNNNFSMKIHNNNIKNYVFVMTNSCFSHSAIRSIFLLDIVFISISYYGSKLSAILIASCKLKNSYLTILVC